MKFIFKEKTKSHITLLLISLNIFMNITTTHCIHKGIRTSQFKDNTIEKIMMKNLTNKDVKFEINCTKTLINGTLPTDNPKIYLNVPANNPSTWFSQKITCYKNPLYKNTIKNIKVFSGKNLLVQKSNFTPSKIIKVTLKIDPKTNNYYLETKD